MGVAETIHRGRETVVERPGTALVALLGAYFVLDLFLKLLWISGSVEGIQLLGGQLKLSDLLTLVWDGLVIGLAIGLAGIGLSMTYSILNFANFAHGDYVTGGAFIGWAAAFVVAGSGQGDIGYLLSIGWGSGPSPAQLGINVVSSPLAIVLGLLIAGAGTLLLVLAIDRVVYKPMRDQGAISLLIASIGVALALRYMILFMFGGRNRGLTASQPQAILAGVDGQLKLVITDSLSSLVLLRNGQDPGQNATVLDIPFIGLGGYNENVINVTAHEITLVVVSLALMFAVHLTIQRTKLGTAMRAMADNEDLALITGIPTERVITFVWAMGGSMAGFAGFLLALERETLTFDFGWVLLLLIFAAVIIGGIGSIYGAMAGGVIIGLTQNLALIWIPSGLSTVAAFAILILVLLFRPEGLFKGVTTA